ncbi:ATP-binding protein [Streptomyces aidingensis]|uniref:ATP-binding protein n=1 Tax=Streptomyces aidingensis TaxID=910347 RepID=UPI001FE6DFF4|nr:ATP-binding protein [Streptomyces aidingensis]
MPTSSDARPVERPAEPMAPGGLLSFRLAAVQTSAAEARRRTVEQLTAWCAPGVVCDNAQLVMSELVTNALRHTCSEWVRCELRRDDDVLRVAVSSEGPGPQGPPAPAGEEEESGRGLLLVVALSIGWGVRRSESGRGHTVWADLDLRPAVP